MKTLTLSLILLAAAQSSFALDKLDLDHRIMSLTVMLDQLQSKPDKSVPGDLLARAQGVILLHRAKGGLVFGYQHGDGVAMVKDKYGAWSAPAWMSDNEGSFGAQIGGETSFILILLMDTNAFTRLTDTKVEFSGEARGTAGGTSAGEEGKVNELPPVLVCSDRTGLYGGATIKGGAVSPNPDADAIYYGQGITTREILFENKVKPSDAAELLIKKLSGYAVAKPKQ